LNRGGARVADRPLHIAIDGRELLGKPTGVGRYVLEVLKEWSQTPHRYSVIVPDEPTAPLRQLGDRFQWVVEAGAGAGTRWEQTRLPRAVARVKPDVFLAAANTAPLRLACPFVVVVYDVSYFAHPEWFGRREGLRRRWLTRSAARRARTVVTISEFSRQEIARYLRTPLDKIDVAFPGAPAEQRQSAVDREPVVLYVGSLFNRRRIDDLMRGFAETAPRVPGARLVLVGDNRTSPRIDPNELARRLGIADRFTWHNYVDDAEVSRLYATARVFAFLSDYEGFGIPPLEAISHGVPVVLLDTAVAREIYGTGAVFVPPVTGEISGALHRLLTDPVEHASVLDAGRERLRAYSWPRTARAILTALERAAS
jgi:glycosyltransferase involved in cell wall biosynthesis